MKIQGIYHLLQVTLLLLFVSCSEEETGGIAPLPDSKYPLQLTAKVAQPQTRAGGKDSWTGGEEIGVMLEGMLDPKKYVMDASGKAEPVDAENTIYWQNTAETRVTAWTPNIFDPNVDISDQSGGYADFDLLYATALGRYDRDVNLRFNHRMAKIEVTLAAGDGITEETIEGATVTFLGDSEAYFSGGMVGLADKSDGEIKPYHDAAMKKYEAVVVPQNMTDKPLVRIDIGGKTFAYTPETDAAGNLEANKRYAYTITVNANSIDVQAVTGGTWNDGGEEDVEIVLPIIYTADEVKTGDYIYSDGTTSDGGLRKRYPNGKAPVIADPKPQAIAGKTVVGIVFWTPKDTDPTGRQTPASLTDDKVMATEFPNCTHGLAISLKFFKIGHLDDLGFMGYWQRPAEDVINFQNSQNFNPSNKSDYVDINSGKGANDRSNKILGYQNTKILKAYNAYCETANRKQYAVTVIDSLTKLAAATPAPANSTGWYIPSVKELHIAIYKDVDDIFARTGTETRNLLNTSLSIVGGDIIPSGSGRYAVMYLSSTEWLPSGYAFFGHGVKTDKATAGSFLKDQIGTGGFRAVFAF